MGLWIRSQNKLKLLKANNLSICYGEKWYNENSLLVDKYEYSYEIQNENICIGIYKSKERALEVLDEIQQLLIEYYQSIDYKIVPVYEMPKE